MASLKAVSLRIRSIGNIGKITKAMKLVSAAKFKYDERRMVNGMPFAEPVTRFFEKLPEAPAQVKDNKTVQIVALSSDKGMCGAINSGVVKKVRIAAREAEKDGSQVGITCVGNKSVSGLKRLYGDKFSRNLEGCQQPAPFNFTHASLIAESIIQADPARCEVVGNVFKNMVTYECVQQPVYTKQGVAAMEKTEFGKLVDQYEFEPSTHEVWEDLHEFYYASAIFAANLTGIASEQSSRMAAMENASKNATEEVDRLTLVYNRGRQAKITTELCEIISGASAL